MSSTQEMLEVSWPASPSSSAMVGIATDTMVAASEVMKAPRTRENRMILSALERPGFVSDMFPRIGPYG